jgi:hypothetical protein
MPEAARAGAIRRADAATTSTATKRLPVRILRFFGGLALALVIAALLVVIAGLGYAVDAIAVMGVLYVAATLGMNLNRSLRDMDTRPAATTAQPASG